MSLPLSDERLDRVLVELARSSGEEIAAAAPTAEGFAERLVGRQALPRRGPALGPFTAARWQLAALLLLALAIAGAVAAGALLLRQISPRLLLLPPHGLDCRTAGVDLPEGQVMRFGGLDSDAMPTGTLVLLEDDSLVLVPATRTQAQVVAADAAMSARRLSPRGVGLVRDAIAESGLLARGCRLQLLDPLTDTPLRGITVRDSDGALAETEWGYYHTLGGFLRPMSETEKAAAALLVERLEKPEAWLPADAWVDPEPRPYDPDRWRLTAELLPADRLGELDPPAPTTGIPDVATVRLPGGAGLLDFGTSVISSPGEGQLSDIVERCEVLDTAGARVAAAAVYTASPPRRGIAWFARGPDVVGVSLEPLVPGGQVGLTCRSDNAAVVDQSSVTGPWSLPPVDPCSLMPWYSASSSQRTLNDRRFDGFQGHPGYASCMSLSGSEVIAIRRQSTSATQAPLLARMWLGGDAASVEVAGHPGWTTGCEALHADPRCDEGVAILVGRRFIIVTLAPREADHVVGALTLADLPGIVDRLERQDAGLVEP